MSLGYGEPAGTDDELLAEAEPIAAASDVAIVVVGTTDEVESEGFDRTDLALPGRQDELVRRVAAVQAGRSSSSTRARRSSCRGPTTSPRCC